MANPNPIAPHQPATAPPIEAYEAQEVRRRAGRAVAAELRLRAQLEHKDQKIRTRWKRIHPAPLLGGGAEAPAAGAAAEADEVAAEPATATTGAATKPTVPTPNTKVATKTAATTGAPVDDAGMDDEPTTVAEGAGDDDETEDDDEWFAAQRATMATLKLFG